MASSEITIDFLKVTPPVGVSVSSFAGIPLNEWVYIATIGYIIIQSALAVYKTIKQTDKEKERP